MVKTEEYKVEIEEIEKIVSEKLSRRVVVKRIDIGESGDYDRGTYKQWLKSITFMPEEENKKSS